MDSEVEPELAADLRAQVQELSEPVALVNVEPVISEESSGVSSIEVSPESEE